MRSATILRIGSLAAAASLVFFTTACASDNTSSSAGASAAADAANDAAQEAADVIADAVAGTEDGDRVFGTTDDNVIVVIEQTLSSQNAKAEWAGSDMRVALDGSVDDITAQSPCLAIEALLTTGEDAVLVYSDGELRCSER